jgi:response regulator RpfG family c-di-GMP phosphodiesterase
MLLGDIMTKKNKIVYAEDLDDLREIYSMAIEAETNSEVIEFNCGNDLIAYLEKNHDVDLVLSDHQMPNGSGSDIYRFLKESGRKIPFGLLSSDSPTSYSEFNNFLNDHSLNFYLVKPIFIKDLTKNVSNALKATKMDQNVTHVPVHMRRLEKFNPQRMDVYVKTEDQKLIKLLSSGEWYSEEHHGKHREKYGDYFYVLKQQYVDFCEQFLLNMKKELGDPKLRGQNRVEKELIALQQVHDLADAIGIDPKIVQMTDVICTSIVENFKSNQDELSLLFTKNFKSSGYLIEHSILVAYLSCALAERVGWSSNGIHEKFTLAALLHDLGLDDDTAKINNYSDLVNRQLDWNESKKIAEHPQLVSEMLAKTGSFSTDVELMVLSHHERPDAKGFPKKLTALTTSPIACLFNTSEEFVVKVMSRVATRENFKEILNEMEEEYSKGNYKKPFQELKKLLSC